MNETVSHSPQIDPRELLRQFRNTYVNAHALKAKGVSAFTGTNLKTRKEHPITEKDLPQDLRFQLEDFGKRHGHVNISLVKYMRMENGMPAVVIEDPEGLLEEDQLSHLSQTLRLNSSAEVRVVTHIVVAHIEIQEDKP